MHSVVEREVEGEQSLEGDFAAASTPRWDFAFVLAAPVVILLLLQVSPYFKLNNGDPFIYVGYSNAFRTHIERFGYTYHSVRFGLIFPLRASLTLGPVVGYFLLRYLLYLVAIVPMWTVLRPLGRRVALLGPVLFIANPVSAQAILTTHPDTIVVPGVTFTLCMVVLAVRAQSWPARLSNSFAAGLATGITLNANIFAVPLLGVIMLSGVAALVWRRRFLGALGLACLGLLGAGLVSVAGMIVYRQMFGDWNIYRTTWNAMNDISESDIWRTPSLEWMSTRRYIYAPAIAVIFATAAVLRRRKRSGWPPPSELVVLAAVSGGLFFYITHQFVLGGASMEQAYYYSYLIGPVCLLTALAFAWQGGIERSPVWVVCVVPIAFAWASQVVEIRAFAAFLAVLTILLFATIRSKALAGGTLALLAMQLSWGASPRSISTIEGAGFQYEPHYERAFGDADRAGFDNYVIASELLSVVPSTEGTVAPLLFWYRTGDAVLDSTQATFHWESLTVQTSPNRGMPEITDDDFARLRALQGGHVVLLGTEPEELRAATGALESRGFDIEPADIVTLKSGSTSVLVQPVRVIGLPPPSSTE